MTITLDRPATATLQRAAIWLRTNGWTHHAYGDDRTGPGCLEAAVAATGGDLDLVAALTWPYTPAEWNDLPERTLDDILALLDGPDV